MAKSNNPETWVNFDHACLALAGGKYDGIGFVVTQESGIVGGDLDHCINKETGELATWADAIIRKIDTYTETTPSGEGVRFFAKGELPGGGRKNGNVEMYADGRFLTITGNHWPDTPLTIEERTVVLSELHGEYFDNPITPEVTAQPLPQNGITVSRPVTDDAARLELMLTSKSADKVRPLWEGNWQSQFKSQSEADSALCFHLAWWFEKDAVRIDAMFRQSGLMREKWDNVHHSSGETYGSKTIAFAINTVTDCFEPQAEPRFLRGRTAAQFINGQGGQTSNGEQSPVTDADEEAVNNGLYAIHNGRTMLAVKKEKSDDKGSTSQNVRSFVWDGAACIVGEIYDEEGTTLYDIEGKTIFGKKFRFEFDSARMSDPKAVSAMLNNHAGAECVIYAGMEKHLAPAIKSFTDPATKRYGRRFRRVGWTKDMKEFIIPGLEPDDVMMALPKDLAYRVEAPGENGLLNIEAIVALHALLDSHNTHFTTVAVCHALLASLAALCGWRDDKFALFVVGRTGSFKTSVASLVMCLYGDFSNEDKLLKFGMGATQNALMGYTTSASDVPLLIDNFKPGTGAGQKDAQTLIHGVLEGGEKKRLNRDGTLRESREIHCWPCFTGEDVVDDAASVARTLIVNAAWSGGEDNPALTKAQTMAHHLPEVGGVWLSWLMTDEAKVVAGDVKSLFFQKRASWSMRLRHAQPDMVNIARVASSLALCECAWEAALRCPALNPILSNYSVPFALGLTEIADSMGSYAAQTHEANRYLSAIRAMIETGNGEILGITQEPVKSNGVAFLGWADDQFVYLHPENAYKAVLEYLRDAGGLNGLAKNTIHRQLDQLGFLARKNEKRKEYPMDKRLGPHGKNIGVLWMNRSLIFSEDEQRTLNLNEED